MAFDYKKEYKEFYMPKATPMVVDVPSMQFIAVDGTGNPNDPDGEYQKALGLLYPIAYTLKMSYKTDYRIDGFYEYVVPPLEGLWWTDGENPNDFTDKSAFKWTAMIRVPDFIKKEDVEWAKREVARKKGIDCSSLRFMTLNEGLCAQILHVGPYDAEPTSLAAIDNFIEANGYVKDISGCVKPFAGSAKDFAGSAKDVTVNRRHHEIYLSDPRRCTPEKLKTVIRIPITRP